MGKTNTELREGQELKILISVPYAALYNHVTFYRRFPCRFERWYCCREMPACRCIQWSILCQTRSSQFFMVDSFWGHVITSTQ